MPHTPNLFPLKLLVISLGLILIGGTIFLVVTVTSRIHKESAASHCPDTVVHLAATGTLTATAPQGATVQLTLRSGEATKILTVDRCTGNVLQTLTIAP